jgi:hypothetical protein
MAKLYAELTSDKGGRVAGKGGEDFISCRITKNGKIVAHVEYCNGQLHINDTNDTMPIVIGEYQVQ